MTTWQGPVPPVPPQRRDAPWLRFVLRTTWVLTTAGAVAAWIWFELRPPSATPVLLICAVYAVSAATLAALHDLGADGGLRGIVENLGLARYGAVFDPLAKIGRQFLLPLAAMPIMFATLPVEYVSGAHDNAAAAVIALTMLLGAPFAMLCGCALWTALGLPIALVARRRSRAQLGREVAPADRGYLLGVGLVLFSVVAFAVCLALAAPDTGSNNRHAAVVNGLLVLVGAGTAHLEHPVLLWCARLAVVLVVVSIVRLGRAVRRQRR